MKQKFEYVAVDAQGIEQLAFTLNATQGQAERVFYSMAYAMATDGGWKKLSVYLVTKGDKPFRRGEFNTATFKGGKA